MLDTVATWIWPTIRDAAGPPLASCRAWFAAWPPTPRGEAVSDLGGDLMTSFAAVLAAALGMFAIGVRTGHRRGQGGGGR